MFSKKSSKGERSYKELHISISSTFHTLRILIRLYDESSSWILFFTLQYYVLQVCLISSTLPWAPHIAIIRSRMKKGKFNALVRNHIHWAIWEHHLRSQVRISFEIYIYIYIYNPSYFTEGVEVIQIQSFRSSTIQDDMVDTPKESQVQVCLGTCLHYIILGFMFSTLVLNLYLRTSKGLSVGELVDGR
jgi:hypothetical protein